MFQLLKNIVEFQHLMDLYDVSHSSLDFSLILQCQFLKGKVKKKSFMGTLRHALTLIFRDIGEKGTEITCGIYKISLFCCCSAF